MASPAPKKWGGPNHVSLLVSSKSYNIHTWGTSLYVKKKLFNGFALIPRGVWTEVGGDPDPSIPPPPPPVATPLGICPRNKIWQTTVAHTYYDTRIVLWHIDTRIITREMAHTYIIAYTCACTNAALLTYSQTEAILLTEFYTKCEYLSVIFMRFSKL